MEALMIGVLLVEGAAVLFMMFLLLYVEADVYVVFCWPVGLRLSSYEIWRTVIFNM